MANKRITDVDFIDSLSGNESFFINKDNSIKQINKTNIVFGMENGGTGAKTAEEVLTNLGLTATAAELNIMDGISATTDELNYVSGVTSNIQAQLDEKLSTSGGNLTGNLTLDNGSVNLDIGNVNLTNGSVKLTNGDVELTMGDVKITNGDLELMNGDFNIGNGDYIMCAGSVLGVPAVDGVTDREFIMPVVYMSPEGNIHLGRNQSESTTHDGNTYVNALKGSVYLKNSNGSLIRWFKYAGENYNNILRCETDSDATLGSESSRWYRVYCATSSLSTSDEREKSDITSISDYPVMYTSNADGNILEQFFDKLIPVTYTLNVENTNDLHIGFIAQDVEKAANELGMTIDDLGFIARGYWTDEETGEERDRYSLGYEEFIALNTHMIQKQRAMLKEQRSEIELLKERIAKLESNN